MSAGIRRAPRQGNFDIVDRKTVRDKSLSYRARGVLMRLLSNADGYSMTAIDLARDGKEGRDAILAALKELREKDYLLTRRFQNEQGKWLTENTIFDRPQPSPENPTSVNQTSVFQSLKVGRAIVLKAAEAAAEKIEDAQPDPARSAGKSKGQCFAGKAGKKKYFSQPEFGQMELEEGNERDTQTADLLVKKYGLEKINEAVARLVSAGKRGFPTSVAKALSTAPAVPKKSLPHEIKKFSGKKYFGENGNFVYITFNIDTGCRVEIWRTESRCDARNQIRVHAEDERLSHFFHLIIEGKLKEVGREK